MRLLQKPAGTLFQEFDDKALIFSSISGQTILVDSSVTTILSLLPEGVFVEESELFSLLSNQEETNKSLLSSFFNDIINSLIHSDIIISQ